MSKEKKAGEGAPNTHSEVLSPVSASYHLWNSPNSLPSASVSLFVKWAGYSLNFLTELSSLKETIFVKLPYKNCNI